MAGLKITKTIMFGPHWVWYLIHCSCVNPVEITIMFLSVTSVWHQPYGEYKKKFWITKLYWMVIKYPGKKIKDYIKLHSRHHKNRCCVVLHKVFPASWGGQFDQQYVFHCCAVITKHLSTEFYSACGTNTADFIFKNIYVKLLQMPLYWEYIMTNLEHFRTYI